MSALAGGWAVAATLSQSDPRDFDGANTGSEMAPVRDRSPAGGSIPSMSDRLYFNENPRLIAC
jgi:hypothetical protein